MTGVLSRIKVLAAMKKREERHEQTPIDELKRMIQQVWDELTLHTNNALVHQMPRMLRQVEMDCRRAIHA
jgi:hypothetical protein